MTYPLSRGAHSLSSDDLTWLRRLARSLVVDPERADDLVQDTLLAALGTPQESIREPRAWLRSVARRLRARQARAEIRRGDHERLASETTARSSPLAAPASADLVAAAEAGERVAAVARALPEPYRRTILEHYLEGLEPAQIAERSTQKVDTVRWRLRRGLALMRSELDRMYEEASNDTARDQAKGPGNESWAIALGPLVGLADSHGAAAAGAAATLTQAPAPAFWGVSLIAMKLTASLLLIVALGVALLSALGARTENTSPGDSAGADFDAPPGDLRQAPGAPAEELALVGARTSRASIDERDTPEDSGPPSISGTAIDESGRPVEGAVVYVLEAARDQDGDVKVAARTNTESDGRFLLVAQGESWGGSPRSSFTLGVAATGLVPSARRTLSHSLSLSDIELTLRLGATIEGRVEDVFGRPVPGLSLWAGDKFSRARDLSMSRVQLRGAERLITGPDQGGMGQAVARTDGAGRVTLTGLPQAPCIVRSLDPAWQLLPLEPTDLVQGGSRGVVWTAAPRYGIRLRASLDGAPLWADGSGALSDVLSEASIGVSSTFLVELAMADGSTFETGQWIGSGPGEVTLALRPDMDPRVDFDEVESATFYGVAQLDDQARALPAEWRSAPISRSAMESGAAPTAFVDFRRLPSLGPKDSADPGELPLPTPLTDVEFDVRIAGTGAPFDGPLYVEWECTLADGTPVEGDGRAKRLAGGRYGLQVPAEKVSFRVAVSGASGSLPPWTGSKICSSLGKTVVFVELEGGGEALVQRPSGWEGQWWIRAARRAQEDGEETWFGAWNYSIDAPIHPLRALRAGTWRFQLREAPDQDLPSEVRIVEIRPGETVDVR